MIQFLLRIPAAIIGALCWAVVVLAIIILFGGAAICVMMQMSYDAMNKLFSLGDGNDGV